MKIAFRDSSTRLLFNDHARLEGRYGSDVADKIASRMALLSVAANLAQLPVREPISLRADGGDGLFTVDAGPDHRLQFRGLDGKPGRGKASQVESIEDIEVIGIRSV
jgi:hypothetical protein